MTFGCFSDVCARRAGDGAVVSPISVSPILLVSLAMVAVVVVVSMIFVMGFDFAAERSDVAFQLRTVSI